MQITLDKIFNLPNSPDTAWLVLKNLEVLAVCMPGASIKEQVADNKWTGAVKIKAGPANIAFAGEIILNKINPEKYLIELKASGKDAGSIATMNLTAHIEPTDDGCCLKGKADVELNGRIVSLGSRMIKPLADQILNQFGENFTSSVKKIEEESANKQSKEQVLETAKSASKDSESINSIALLWGLIKGFFAKLFK